jgi:hypothetical protein
MGERILSVGGNMATRPISDFMLGPQVFGPPAAEYYVDGNVSTTGSGSATHPFSTLEEAIDASNTSIALSAHRWWARRNRIYCCGDALDESLTQLPTKCDVIGCGSYDGYTRCGLSGMHSSAEEAYGTRWFNMHFLADAAAAAIFTLAGATSVSGQQFIGCTFDATLGTVTSGILATAMPFLKVIGCEFKGAFATSYITFGTGECGGALIQKNTMSGSLGTGIAAGSGATATWLPIIDSNIIRSTGMWVDDDAAIFAVINNRATTAIDCATYTAGFDFNLLLASGNLQTGGNAGDCDSVPHTLFA